MTSGRDDIIRRLDEAMAHCTTGRNALPDLLRDCKVALTIGVAASLTPKEAERLQRLRKYAYELQNRLDRMPERYEMGYTRARLSAICWAVEKISGIPFKPESVRPEEDAKATVLSLARLISELPVPLHTSGAVAVEGTYLSVAAANHLRRLVAWVRCDVGQSPAELVDTVKRIAPALGDISDYGKNALVEAHHKSAAVPQYVRAAIKALEKSIAGVPQEAEATMPVARCERMLLCEDTFDSMEQVMPILADIVNVVGMTPAMAANASLMEVKRLREELATMRAEK